MRRLSPVPSEPQRSEGDRTADPDAELLGRCAQGDQAAFAQLYDRSSERVYGLVRRVVRNPDLAQEVTQEVFVEIWRSSSRFDPAKGSSGGWMLAVAHRRAVDRVRSEEAAGRRDQRYAERSVAPGHDSTAQAAEDRSEHDRLRSALASLTPLQRRSIELAFYEGRTHTEVADVLEIPLGTAKTRIRDGLLRLRDAMGEPA